MQKNVVNIKNGRMITELDIFNFQSHEETHLIFHPGVNVIIGNSDSGKTAIIRSLRKLVWNKPAGDAMRSTWGGETRIGLETEEGSVIWSKDKVDKYTLNTSLSRKNTIRKGLEFKAFGTSVPEEISRFLNLNEINLQQQLDSPFLLSETSGKVAEHFNKVAKLDKIDLSTQNINSWIRKLNDDIGHKENDIFAHQALLQKFEHLDKFEAGVEVLEDMDKRYVTALQRQTKLETFISDIKDVKAAIKEFQPLLELEEPLNQIFEWRGRKRVIEKDKEVLETLCLDISQINEEIEFQNNLTSLETPINNLLNLYKEVNTLDSQRNLLFKAISSLRSIRTRLKTAEAEKADLQAKFEKVFPSVCPLCGTKIK
jgi:exonuclease SbcC